MSDLLVAVILGIVEGLTEFIPVSSTGHLIVAGELLGFTGDKAETFEVVIQLGAILAVALIYRRRLVSLLTLAPGEGVSGRNGLILLALTTLPALIVGAAAHGFITDRLFSPTTVAIGWGLGGVGLLLVERYRPYPRTIRLTGICRREAIAIGLFQCLSLWPGASRAAATIGGGMMVGLARPTAAEFSFLAAMPVIGAASVLELYTSRDLLGWDDVPMFAVGFVVSFVVAWLAVRFFLSLVAHVTLRPFGWYRIATAALVLIAVAAGWID